MDNKLLVLWRYFSTGSIRIEEIAETLQLSHKQTTRYLKKWTEEGWMTFTSGRGRGNVSNLVWLKNVEDLYEEQVMKLLDKEPVERSSKYIMYDWSSDSKMRIMTKFYTKFGYQKQTADKLVVPRKYPFITFHPLKAADVNSAHLVANVFNRLVSITENGEIVPEIAHSWDMSQTKLRLYLKKDIRFHDGSILTAEDVVTCLENVRIHKNFKNLWSPVKEVVSVAPLVVDIHHPDGCSYSLQILSMMNASIYKENKGELLGTGGFYIEGNNEKKTTLTAFKDYFQERPLLDAVEFVQVPKDFNFIYQSAIEQKTIENDQATTFKVESDSGFGVLIMNACRDSIIKKKEVRNYLHHIIIQNLDTIHRDNENISPNGKSCFIGENRKITVPKGDRPAFHEPIVIGSVNYTKNMTNWLKEIIEKDGIPVEIKWFSFADSLNKDTINQEVDLFIHGEVFEMNQHLSFYNFLTNGFSPLTSILRSDEKWRKQLNQYIQTPFSEWSSLNLQTEKMLIESSIMIPLYYARRQIPFSSELMNINIKHFGYVDFSKLWVRPLIK